MLGNFLPFPAQMGMSDMSSHAAAAAAHYSPHYPYQVSLTQLKCKLKITKEDFLSGQWSNVTAQPIQPSSSYTPSSLAQCVARWNCVTTRILQSLQLQSGIGRRIKYAFDELNIRNRCRQCNLQDGTRYDVLFGKIIWNLLFAVAKLNLPFLLKQQANPNELNHTDGILNGIFNDEDLQLMDMAVNEGKLNLSCYQSSVVIEWLR